MCFSAEASFATAAVLVPAGAYCISAAVRKAPHYLGLAAVPLLFGVQQCAEGFVWFGLHHDDADLTRTAALCFLFFALAFWPFWIPLTVALLESKRRRKAIIAVITLLSLTWAMVLYYPVATDPQRWLTVRDEHHSVRYAYYELPVYALVSPPWLRLLYFGSIALPFAFCSDRQGLTFGLVLAASALTSHLVFSYAFVSVWCFFAALLALYLCVVFYRMQPAAPANA